MSDNTARPAELDDMVNSLACLNEGIALIRTVESAIENCVPDHVLVTIDEAIEQLVSGRDGLLHAGVNAMPKETVDYYKTQMISE